MFSVPCDVSSFFNPTRLNHCSLNDKQCGCAAGTVWIVQNFLLFSLLNALYVTNQCVSSLLTVGPASKHCGQLKWEVIVILIVVRLLALSRGSNADFDVPINNNN